MTMSEPKFTKGPWTSAVHPDYIEVRTAYDCFDGEDNIGPETICVIGGLPTIPLDGGAEWKATGDLIAAAPDMYKVLAGMEEAFDNHFPESRLGMLITWEAFEKVREALRKARGELSGNSGELEEER